MPVYVKIDKPKATDQTVRKVDLPFLMPHMVFHHTYTENKEIFFRKFVGSSPEAANDTLSNFWSEVISRRDPRIIRHPMCSRPDWQRWAIPVSLHGDAVPVVRVGKPGTQSLDCLSFQSLMPVGITMDLKLLMFCIFEKTKSASLLGSRTR